MKSHINLLFLGLILLSASLSGQENQYLSAIERQMLEQGLVNIHSIAPDILVDLKYSTEDNFLGLDVYGNLETCYLQIEAATKLSNAQKLLKKEHPELTLLVYDGARPRSVQRKMWALVSGTPSQGYVANPDRGSVHNFGSAVDLTLSDTAGNPLDMGTPFDFFGDLAQPRYEKNFLETGKLTTVQVENRQLLRKVMMSAGFQPIRNEWWHFNALPVKEARHKYKIIE